MFFSFVLEQLENIFLNKQLILNAFSLTAYTYFVCKALRIVDTYSKIQSREIKKYLDPLKIYSLGLFV